MASLASTNLGTCTRVPPPVAHAVALGCSASLWSLQGRQQCISASGVVRVQGSVDFTACHHNILKLVRVC
jgi:hypothetical protein